MIHIYMMKNMYSITWGLILVLYLIPQYNFGQNNTASPKTPPPSSLAERKTAVEQKQNLQNTSIFKDYPLRSIGPTVMGGRIVDLDVDLNNPNTFYVAYASGGVFKTTNNGLTFEPIFDRQARLTVGDIALSPANAQTIWVGTGENNSSRSSYAGFGIYKSENGGKDWIHCGLENTQHIGRIVCHPTELNTAWVAAIGALYSHNPERGVFKTIDGGKTWKKTLFINDSTGVIDLVVNPQNPNQLWAAAWERDRSAWDFKENGPGSGLYISEDGGETWKKITQGLPASQHLGRIGLDISRSQPHVLYLIVDNQEEIRKESQETEKLPFTFKDFEKMTVSDFLNLKDTAIDTFLTAKGFPSKYTAAVVKKEIKAGKYSPRALAAYFDNANEDLFNTTIKGAEVYRSDDSGKSWLKVNSYELEGLFYTYGYYFGQIRVDPQNPDRIYIFGVPLLRSDDGGKTYQRIIEEIYGDQIHADHHALWINPKNPAHIINGNDGGLYVSYDLGDNFLHFNNVAVGQFYTVAVDMENPYQVYGGLQDNGVFKGSSKGKPNDGKPWERIWGGDGMYVQVHPKNNQLIYTGFQFGNYWRIENGKTKKITPVHNLGEAPLRFNWRTPLVLSKHNPDIVYFGTQRLYRSLDRGDNWQAISPDLTQNKPQGNVPYSTITSIAESPLDFALIYIGTDDGQVQVSRNGGASWESISKGLPPQRWISSIFASPHDLGTVYLTLNGYRYDELKSYVYKSIDYGKTWSSIRGNLPDEALNVIIQDPKSASLLYLGTDEGAYVSMDGGVTWHVLTGDFPNVATYDMIVHPREQELVLATHGRSMYVMDIKPLQKLAQDAFSKKIYLFPAPAMTHSDRWNEPRPGYLPASEPVLEILYFVNHSEETPLEIFIKDQADNQIFQTKADGKKGFHKVNWNLKDLKGNFIKPGEYNLVLVQGKETTEISWELKKNK
ncbi:MAG: glycosyl hydrolase [Microscillaceae bacterium]|nr:glycosyl hydrolase [Microscillaceae bacterium]